MNHELNLPAIAASIHQQLQNLNINVTSNQIAASVQKSFSDTTNDYENIKKANGILHEDLKTIGAEIKRTSLLDVVARALGHKNHHALKQVSKASRQNWYDFAEGRITVIVGPYGSGKSVLIAKHSISLDSVDTLVVDYGNFYSRESIDRFNRETGSRYHGFRSATHIDAEKGTAIPSPSGYKRIIIDEPSSIDHMQSKNLRRAIARSPNAHIILLMQAESDMTRYGMHPKYAERVIEKIGHHPGIKNGAEMIKAYLFDRKAIATTLNLYTILSIFRDIQAIKLASNDMHNYVNSLDREDYSLLATVFDLGRQGWARDYYETEEYQHLVEEMEAEGERVTQEIADRRFLSKAKKQEQFDWTYRHMLGGAIKHNGEYNHNWLTGKVNLISAALTGIGMLHELA